MSDEDRDEAEPMYKTISQEPQRSQREGSPSSQMVLEDPVAESDELSGSIGSIVNDGLTIAETAKLSVEFCIPWVSGRFVKIWNEVELTGTSNTLQMACGYYADLSHPSFWQTILPRRVSSTRQSPAQQF